MLSDVQIERYSRQIILPQVGGSGQERLLAARVALAGGGVQAEAAGLYLAAAGVGTLTLIDDRGGLTEALTGLNPDCVVRVVEAPATHHDAIELAAAADVIVDGTSGGEDDPLNRACVVLQRPLLWGTVAAARGHVVLLCAGHPEAPCRMCVTFPAELVDEDPSTTGEARREQEPSGEDAASLLRDLTAAFVGCVQATEAIRLLLGHPGSLDCRMLTYSAVDLRLRADAVERNPACATCAGHAGNRG